MNKDTYLTLEKYMLSCMTDAAHDCQHIYRVLYTALDIAKDYEIDMDVLIASCLLHDIGREAQFKDETLDHATVGADMAFDYLINMGWSQDKANHVKRCISTHRYRNDNLPESIEAKILFDSDKLDVSGAIGIARTLAYTGIVGEPLYSIDEHGNVLQGTENEEPSFFQEYNWKLKKIYKNLYTDRAKLLAEDRRKSSIDFYNALYEEVNSTHKNGLQRLKNSLEDL